MKGLKPDIFWMYIYNFWLHILAQRRILKLSVTVNTRKLHNGLRAVWTAILLHTFNNKFAHSFLRSSNTKFSSVSAPSHSMWYCNQLQNTVSAQYWLFFQFYWEFKAFKIVMIYCLKTFLRMILTDLFLKDSDFCFWFCPEMGLFSFSAIDVNEFFQKED